jgi:hypothetical protein
MAAIAVVGVLAFLVLLVGRALSRSKDAASEGAPSRWYQYLLAALLLLVVVILGIWQFSTQGLLGQAVDWRADSRAITFFVIMLVVGGLGLIGFLVYLIAQSSRQGATAPTPATAGTAATAATGASAPESSEAVAQPTSAGLRMLGLLALFAAFLLLNWVYLPREEQYLVVLRLIYPASLAVALVLLFDKAARGWNVKGGAENLREWLLCDGMTFLLILGFLNLQQQGGGEKYAAMFWDVLYVALFFLIFWLLDRTGARLRFLLVHAYLIALPILLLIWRAVQGVAVPADLSWWSSIWPFFFLAIIAFVLEIIVLLVQGDEGKHGLGAVKDTVFVAVYGILLIIAVPEVAV